MPSPTDLWHAWQTSPEIRTHTESWLTRNPADWTDDDNHFCQRLPLPHSKFENRNSQFP